MRKIYTYITNTKMLHMLITFSCHMLLHFVQLSLATPFCSAVTCYSILFSCHMLLHFVQLSLATPFFSAVTCYSILFSCHLLLRFVQLSLATPFCSAVTCCHFVARLTIYVPVRRIAQAAGEIQHDRRGGILRDN